MNRLRGAVFVLFFLLLVPAALADFSVESKPVRDSIIPGEQAAYDLVIHNLRNVNDTFRIADKDLLWDVSSDPLYQYFSGVRVPARSKGTVRLLFNPSGPLDFGHYKVGLGISNEAGESVDHVIDIQLRPEKPLIFEYLAAVRRIVEIPETVNPQNDVPVTVNLFNRNPKVLDDVKIVFSSNLFNKEIETSLGSLERRQINVSFPIDPQTTPQDDVLTVQLIVDGSVLEPTIREPYKIGAFPNITSTETSEEGFFLKTIRKATYTNMGNVGAVMRLEEPVGSFRQTFTKTDPQAFHIKRADNEFLAWDLELAPDESIVITQTTSYRGLLWIVLILGAVGLAYYLFRSPVIASKTVSIMGLREGGLSELRVVITVRNRSQQSFERVTITDKTPMIVTVSATADIGAVKPASIYNDGKRTVIKWELDKLEKGEERVLSYTLSSKLAILGSVVLPGVAVRFYSPKGTKLVSRSKVVNVKL